MSVPLRILSQWVKPRIQHLIFHVTDRCNLRCKHCFVDLTEKNTMKPAASHEIARHLGRLMWLDIGGGEPFLLDSLPELVSPIDCEVLGIPTNGHFPDKILKSVETLLTATRANDIVVSVSIEGFREQHQAIRTNHRNYDLAFETLRTLRAFAAENPRVKIKCNTVVTTSNIDRLVEFMRHIRDTELVDFHSIILLRGDPYKPEIELPYLARLKTLRKPIFDILDSYLWGGGLLQRNFLKRYYRFLWDTSLATIEQQTQVIPCLGGQTHLVIWANGDVASCEMLPPVGNMLEQPLDQILRGMAMESQVQQIRGKQCACTHNCVMLDSILFSPRNVGSLIAS